MALDQAYFDSISIDLVKKKYYNANKVEALLEDIRRQALLLNRENELLGRQLHALHDRKDEIGDTLLSAKTIAQQIIADAQAQADKLNADAKRAGRELIADAVRARDEAYAQAEAARRELPQRLGDLEQKLRVQMLGLMDEVCGELKEFAGPSEEDAAEAEPDATEAPDDLSDKVDAIAREISAIEED